MSKRGQVTIFVIVAILVVAAVVLYLVFRDKGGSPQTDLPADLEAPYVTFLSCLENDVGVGVSLLESQGGYIYLPEYEQGSAHMPFSSQLNFMGTNVPYWYYVSGNNLQREQVPTKSEMEEQLSRFVEAKIVNCNLDSYSEGSYDISLGKPEVSVEILENKILVNMDMNVAIFRAGDKAEIKNHEIEYDSSLGELYNSAIVVYTKEQDELFLEDYGVDVLDLYAPVNGVELSCSPLVWDAEKVFDDLSVAIEANTQAIKTKGDSDDYFYVDVGIDDNVRFLNSKNWSNTLEVNPTEGQLMMSEPVGNQPGLGILGFCYVPYHFVYNVKYPVLVQVYKDDEIFQFPVAVVIQGNKAREALASIDVENEVTDFCDYKNTLMQVRVLDYSGRPLDADVSYDCSGTSCYIGKTQNGVIEDYFPQCVNGRIIARAEGYKEGSETFSTVDSGRAEVYLDKFYPLGVSLSVDGRPYSGEALVSFNSNDTSKTIFYPEQKEIEITPGEYDVLVYLYGDSELTLGSSVSTQCVEVPKGGLGGLIGLTEEECFDMEIPEQIISKALAGGGKGHVYVLDNLLARSGNVLIDAQSLPEPTTLEQLQENYILFDDKVLEVDFR